MNPPKFWKSWFSGFLIVLAFTLIYIGIVLTQSSLVSLYSFFGLILLLVSFVIGEIIYIHKKLNYLEMENKEDSQCEDIGIRRYKK